MSSIECLNDKTKSDSLCPSTSSSSTIVDNAVGDSITKCKRIECENPAINHPEWDGEYCSAQCLSTFCKDAFEEWLKKRQSNS